MEKRYTAGINPGNGVSPRQQPLRRAGGARGHAMARRARAAGETEQEGAGGARAHAIIGCFRHASCARGVARVRRTAGRGAQRGDVLSASHACQTPSPPATSSVRQEA